MVSSTDPRWLMARNSGLIRIFVQICCSMFGLQRAIRRRRNLWKSSGQAEALECRQLLAADTLSLTVKGVFDEARPTSAVFSGEGTRQFSFGTPTEGSTPSRLTLFSADQQFANDVDKAFATLVYKNGVAEPYSTPTSVTLRLNPGSASEPIEIPISITTTTNTGDADRDSDTVRFSSTTSASPVKTSLGVAYLELRGFSAGSGQSPVNSLTVQENAVDTTQVLVRFSGIDSDDQLREAIPLGPVNGEAIRGGAISHRADVDLYSFRVVANQRVAFDIDTAENGDPGLGSYLRIFDSTGKQIDSNNDAKAPDELQSGFDAYVEHTFEEAGTYYVAVSNWRNFRYDANTGGNDYLAPVDGAWLTGKYKLKLSDPDDQIAEAVELGALTEERKKESWIETGKDADMYAFTVDNLGQTVAFDIDFLGKERGGTRIRLFDANGKLLRENVGAQAPREAKSSESFFRYHFLKGGRYFISVSAAANGGFGAKSGSGDRNGTPGCNYRLVVTPVTETPLVLSSYIQGQVWMPNAVDHKGGSAYTDRLQRISPYLKTVDGRAIRKNVPTWVVTHGRVDRSGSFQNLAASLEGYRTGDQVLLLDWREGAADNDWALGLKGAEWIPLVADWAAHVLKNVLKIEGRKALLVGHSWGTYVSYEIARSMGTTPLSNNGSVRAIVAMDPAKRGSNYQFDAVNFSRVSSISWAIYGNGLFGSATLSSTADESWKVAYTKSGPGIGTDGQKQRHNAPISIFHYLVTHSTKRFNLNRLFSVTHHHDTTGSGAIPKAAQWRDNAIDGIFEGEFLLGKDSSENWNIVRELRYFDPSGKQKKIKASQI